VRNYNPSPKHYDPEYLYLQYMGMNATTLHNSKIGDNCIIAAGAVVPEGIKIPSILPRKEGDKGG